MSAQDLADACEELGYPIPRNVIANMESGRRSSLPLVEVMILAQALHTYPICLIYPVGYIETVQPLPFEYPKSTWDAMHWFTGEPDEPEFGVEDATLRNFRAHIAYERAALAALQGEQRERWKAESATNPAEREQARVAEADYAEKALRAKYQLRTIRTYIREDGGAPPRLPAALADVDPPDTETPEETDA